MSPFFSSCITILGLIFSIINLKILLVNSLCGGSLYCPAGSEISKSRFCWTAPYVYLLACTENSFTHRSSKCWIKQIWKEQQEEGMEEGERRFKCRWEIFFLSEMKDVRSLSITTDVIYHTWPAKSERLLSSFHLLHGGPLKLFLNFTPRFPPQLHADLQATQTAEAGVQRKILILSPYLPLPLLRVVPSLLCPKLLSGMRWSYRIHSIRFILSLLSTQKLLAAQTWCPSISWDGWPLQGAQRSCASEPWQKEKGKNTRPSLVLTFQFVQFKSFVTTQLE